MGVIMPIYTVAILVFFIYTIVKILFKNKNNEEEEEDEEFLNSEYYKNCIAQNSNKKNLVNGDKANLLPQQFGLWVDRDSVQHIFVIWWLGSWRNCCKNFTSCRSST